MTEKKKPDAGTPFEKFSAFTSRILAVPKKEIDAKEKERPKRNPRPSK